ncbi:MAG TPA: STAS domain-containing protein [Candidatus Krumholzibacteria bacterium]|jgi:anti-anti-sigma factor|nr:STAS domain-containing protein [Candidatus Krumholzibacteria bacterium]
MAGSERAGQRLRVLISIQGPVAVAYCAGTLDRRSAEELGARLRPLLMGGVRGVVCALDRVQHVHFQALELLIELHRLVRAAGGQFVLTGATPYVRQILDFGGVPRQVTVMASRGQAIEELMTALPSEPLAVATSVQPSLL